MNDQIKKQTNLGIALAVIGFAMIGGALVLVPKLVDEKVKSIRLKEKSAATTALGPAAATPNTSSDAAQNADSRSAESHPNDPKGAAPANASAEKSANTGLTRSESTSAKAASVPTYAPAGNTPPSGDAKDGSSWEIVLTNKYEPNDASKPALEAVIQQMKKNPSLRIRVLGTNNINRMSKLAQIGANRIAGTIIKDARIPSERVEVAVEQKTGMTDVRVIISILGGAR
ncbi:MAG: hypothetical protein JXX14_00265 [Deltaproteobacteria bacterium]|nr:hypothetical protein [Deltaproteobacteria bacterium]